MATAALRVATWNVLHAMDLRLRGRSNINGLAEAIAALDADVVALQEVDRDQSRSGSIDQIAVLAGILGCHGAFAPALLGSPDVAWTALSARDTGGPAYGVGLLSRFPIPDFRPVRLPGGGDGQRRTNGTSMNPGWDHEPRVALWSTIDLGGAKVCVTTTHLSYLPWRSLRQLAVAARAAENGAGPAVLMGDFNLPPWGVGAVASRWTAAGGEPTYPGHDPRMQVDQVLVRSLEVASVRVADPAGSDHRPVVVDLLVH